MKALILVLLPALIGLQSLAQYEKGFLVKTSGDTIQGYFQLRLNKGVIKDCLFKSHPDKKEFTTIPQENCQFIRLNSPYRSYEKWVVSRSMTYIDKFDFTIQNPDSIVTEPILLNLLYKGRKISLYHYEDVKDHFFVFDGEQMTELMISYRYLTYPEKKKIVELKSPAFVTTRTYIDQLKQYYEFGSRGKMHRLLNNCRYEKEDLMKLFLLMDE